MVYAVGVFYCLEKAGLGMKAMWKDAGNQSMFWSGFGAFWAMYSFQDWLAILSIIIGLISGLVNMYAKCQEGKCRDNEERRAEELHRVKMERLRKGVDDGASQN